MKLGRGLKSIAINGFGATGMSAVETLTRAIYFIAITRLAGPEGYGLWSWAISTYAVALGVASLGLETLVPYVYGEGNTTGDRHAGLALAVRIGLALIAILALAAYGFFAIDTSSERFALLLAAPAILFRGVALLNRSIFTGRQEVPRNVPNVLAGRLAELAAGLALIGFGASIAALLLLHWACWALEAFLSSRTLKLRSEVRFAIPNRAQLSPMVSRGAPIGVLDFTSAFLTSAPLILYAPLAAGLGEMGQIGVAMQMAGFMLAASFAFLNSAVPVLAQSRALGDRRVARYGWLVALLAIAATLPLTLVWQWIADPAIRLVVGDGYALASQLTSWSILIAGAILLPHGFQQLLLLESRFIAAISANLLACLSAIAGFAVLRDHIDPTLALQIVLGGSLLRATIMLAAGSVLSARIAKTLNPE